MHPESNDVTCLFCEHDAASNNNVVRVTRAQYKKLLDLIRADEVWRLSHPEENTVELLAYAAELGIKQGVDNRIVVDRTR